MLDQKILKLLVSDENLSGLKPKKIYTENKFFESTENYLKRDLFCLFRHPYYSLKNWSNYKDFLGKLV